MVWLCPAKVQTQSVFAFCVRARAEAFSFSMLKRENTVAQLAAMQCCSSQNAALSLQIVIEQTMKPGYFPVAREEMHSKVGA